MNRVNKKIWQKRSNRPLRDEMIEGDVLEKPAQAKSRAHLVLSQSNSIGPDIWPVLLIALASLVLSVIALGFASFAVWQNDQDS